MTNWKDKGTNQMVLDLKHMQEKHEAIKTQMIKLYDEMETLEKDFNEGNRILKARLNGDNDV